jgi:signal transduction histidine kinase
MSDEKMNSARGTVEITISDTGIGIPESEQQKIFQRFFRASNAVKLVPDGNGLGLAIAKDTVDNHGGQMWFESKDNGGTTFHISIPVQQIKL